jgi:hypothetical protein
VTELRINVIPWAFAFAGLALPWLPGWFSFGLHGWPLVGLIAFGFVVAVVETIRDNTSREASRTDQDASS